MLCRSRSASARKSSKLAADPVAEVRVAEQLAELLGAGALARLAAEVDLVDDHAAERHLRLTELAVEVDGLADRLALRGADDEERGLRVGEQLVDPPGTLAEAADHAAERLEELGQVLEQVDPGDPAQDGEHHRGARGRRPASRTRSAS